MKIVGICCSPRKGQTTRYALDAGLSAAKEAYPTLETELVELAGMKIEGCLACGHCFRALECSQDDDFPGLISLLSAEAVGGIILATPVYFGSVTAQCKAFLDRCVMFRRNGFLLRNKVGGAMAVGGFRNGGQETAIQTIQGALLVQDMIIVGDGKPSAHFGGTLWSGHPEGLEKDDFGLETAKSLGRRVAEVGLRLHG